MLKPSLSFFLSTLLCFTSSGCYAQDQLQRPETTQEEAKKQVEIRTKQGQIHRLLDCRITETSISGKDEKGNVHEYLFENLASINFVPDDHPVETSTKTQTEPKIITLESGGALASGMPTGLDTNGKSESDLKRIVESLPGIMLDARRDKKSEFELRHIAEKGVSFILDDHQYSEFELRHIAEACRKGGGWLHLIDTGKKSEFDLRHIGEAGSFIYSSDKVDRSDFDLRHIAEACLKGGTRLIYADNGKFSEFDLKRLAEAGACIMVSTARGDSEIKRILEKMKCTQQVEIRYR